MVPYVAEIRRLTQSPIQQAPRRRFAEKKVRPKKRFGPKVFKWDYVIFASLKLEILNLKVMKLEMLNILKYEY